MLPPVAMLAAAMAHFQEVLLALPPGFPKVAGGAAAKPPLKGHKTPAANRIFRKKLILGPHKRTFLDKVETMTSALPYIQKPLPYNADINPIAGITDLQMIYQALAGGVPTLEFELRTQRATDRLKTVVRNNLQKYYTAEHRELIAGLFAEEQALPSWKLYLFWQLALTNRLVFEVLDELFFKYYYQGRATLPRPELIAYLKDKKLVSSETGRPWSESTVEHIASKLLTFLKRLEIMEGVAVKHFRNILLHPREWAVFAYLLMAVYPEAGNILEVPLRQFCFASKEAFIEQVRKLALQDYLEMQYDGAKLKISPKYDFKEIVNVLYH
jgi:hypothetical protein